MTPHPPAAIDLCAACTDVPQLGRDPLGRCAVCALDRTLCSACRRWTAIDDLTDGLTECCGACPAEELPL